MYVVYNLNYMYCTFSLGLWANTFLQISESFWSSFFCSHPRWGHHRSPGSGRGSPLSTSTPTCTLAMHAHKVMTCSTTIHNITWNIDCRGTLCYWVRVTCMSTLYMYMGVIVVKNTCTCMFRWEKHRNGIVEGGGKGERERSFPKL